MFLPKLSSYLWSKSLEYAILMKVIKARICVRRIEWQCLWWPYIPTHITNQRTGL